MSYAFLILLVVSAANVTVMGVLIATFTNMYVKTRAQFPLGMMAAVSMLTLPSVVVALVFSSNNTGFVERIASGIFLDGRVMSFLLDELVSSWFPYLLVIGVIELVGAMIFLKLTLD